MKTFSQICCVLLLVSGVASSTRAEADRHLAYRFDYGLPGRVHVTLTMNSPEAGVELLKLPSHMADATGLEREIENLKITGVAVSLVPAGRPWLYQMRAQRGTTVHLDYDLVQDWSGPFRESQRHRVLIRPDLVVFNGENGLVSPKLESGADVQVSLEFVNLRQGGGMVTSFGTEPRQTFTGAWSDVSKALFAEGSFTERRFSVGGAPVLLALAGPWSSPAQEIEHTMQKILGAERVFWRAKPPARYAVVLLPFEDGSPGGGGSAFTDAFTLCLAPGERFGTAAESLAAHEGFHAGNPMALGFVMNPQQLAWFVEGVTTYYQDVMLRRAGLIDAATYLARLNAILRAYDVAPVVQRAADPRGTLDADEARTGDPYLRGALVGLWVNALIVRQSEGTSSLDDLMRSLAAEEGRTLTESRIFAGLGAFLDEKTVDEVRSLVDSGGEVPVLADSLGRCVVIRRQMTWSYDLGMPEAELVKEQVLRDVRPESAAYRAGVRDGQTLLGWTVWAGNAEKLTTLTVRDPGGVTKQLRYLPRGHEVSVRQAELVAGCSDLP